MSPTVHIPEEFYGIQRELWLSLESQHQRTALTMQNRVSVALKQFINDWENPDEQSQLLGELLEHCRITHSIVSNRRIDGS